MKKKVKVEMKGTFRRSGVVVENVGFGFDNPDKPITKLVEISGPIVVVYGVKGAKHDNFKIEITINKVKKTITGKIPSDGKAAGDTVEYAQSDFNL